MADDGAKKKPADGGEKPSKDSGNSGSTAPPKPTPPERLVIKEGRTKPEKPSGKGG